MKHSLRRTNKTLHARKLQTSKQADNNNNNDTHLTTKNNQADHFWLYLPLISLSISCRLCLAGLLQAKNKRKVTQL